MDQERRWVPAPPEASRLDPVWAMTVELVVAIALWAVVGWLADLLLSTGPTLKIVGLLTGTAVGIALLWQRGSGLGYSGASETNHKRA